MMPARAAMFSKLNGLACFLAPLLPTPLNGEARAGQGSCAHYTGDGMVTVIEDPRLLVTVSWHELTPHGEPVL